MSSWLVISDLNNLPSTRISDNKLTLSEAEDWQFRKCGLDCGNVCSAHLTHGECSFEVIRESRWLFGHALLPDAERICSKYSQHNVIGNDPLVVATARSINNSLFDITYGQITRVRVHPDSVLNPSAAIVLVNVADGCSGFKAQDHSDAAGRICVLQIRKLIFRHNRRTGEATMATASNHFLQIERVEVGVGRASSLWGS